MARDRQSIVKMSRREGIALHPKAHKAMMKRAYGPGQHGQSRKQKPSQFNIQLREKQKVKRLYGLLEKQFARLVKEAQSAEGETGSTLLALLEKRLDNVVHRAGLSTSRRGARQIVGHGHLELNGTRVNIPSIRVKVGDVITVRKKSAANEYFKTIKELLKEESPINSWISVDTSKLIVKITGEPQRDELDAEINEQLIVEYYSR